MKVRVSDMLYIFEKYMYKGCKNKKKLYMFERYKMCNIYEIYNILNSDNYNIGNYNIFFIKYPKYRIVMSLNMKDKVINHYLTLNILIPKLSKYLDDRNIATRCGYGSSYGINLIKKYIELTKKYKNVYILKIDIKKYFYSIDHNVLKSMLLSDLNDKEYRFICEIIDSTNREYINEKIDFLIEKELKYTNRVDEVKDIPRYEKEKGIGIGNLSNQFLAIYYLHKLDHYIVHNLGIKYYVRYMDDFLLIYYDKKYLINCLNVIENKLKSEYKLEINKKKCKIYNIKDGFDFLGYTFKVVNNKTICKVSNSSFSNINKKIKYNINNYNNFNLNKCFCSINAYYNGYKYSKSYKVKRYINKLYVDL